MRCHIGELLNVFEVSAQREQTIGDKKLLGDKNMYVAGIHQVTSKHFHSTSETEHNTEKLPTVFIVSCIRLA